MKKKTHFTWSDDVHFGDSLAGSVGDYVELGLVLHSDAVWLQTPTKCPHAFGIGCCAITSCQNIMRIRIVDKNDDFL